MEVELNYKSILLLLLLSSLIHSQSEYKVSAEGFTFGKPVGNNVKLTVFISVSNIGSIEEFNGQIRNIKLKSRQDNSGSYILDDYKKIIDNDKELNGYSVFSLSYIVPVDASDLILVLPNIYGSLNIPISKDDYKNWVAKGYNIKGSTENNNKAKKSTIDKVVEYVGGAFTIGYGINQKNNSFGSIPFELAIWPKIFKIGNNNKHTIFGNVGIQWNLPITSKSSLGAYYGIDDPRFVVKYDQDRDTTDMIGTMFFGGLGYAINLGKVNGITSISYGIFGQTLKATSIRDSISGISYSNPSVSNGAWKIDLGMEINHFYFGYSLIYFEIKNGDAITSGVYRNHLFRIGIGGF